jgi:hypothetical protein
MNLSVCQARVRKQYASDAWMRVSDARLLPSSIETDISQY